MSVWEAVRVALRALRVNLLRSALTMLGIIIGVAAIITMVAVGSGAQARVEEQIRSLGTNLLVVAPGAQQSEGARLATGTRHTLTENDAAAMAREIPSVVVAAPRVNGAVQVVRGNLNWNTTLNGITPDYLVAREWPVAAGRAFGLEEVRSAAKVALIGATVADNLFERDDPVGQTIRVADVPFTVIGVLDRKGQSPFGQDQDDVLFVPLSTAKLRLIGGGHGANRAAIGGIIIKVAHLKAISSTERQVRLLLRHRHRLGAGIGDDFQIRDITAIAEAQKETSQTLTLLLAAVASVSLVVGGISIMNIMLVSVTERTREIGLRLAVGARRGMVRNQFLIEAVTLCFLGGFIGVGVGVGASALVAQLAGWRVIIEPAAILLAVGFSAAVGVFFGFYPAQKASRLDPIEALRFE